MDVDLAKLGRFITDHFDLDQLGVLCQELEVPYDQLVGDTCSARAFDLVTMMRDRGQLSALLAAVARARPDTFDPRDFEAKPQHERAGYGRAVRLVLLGGGAVLVLLAGFFLLSIRRHTPSQLPSASVTVEASASANVLPTGSPVVTSPAPSPSPIVLTATPSPPPATSTTRATSSPSPTLIHTPNPPPTPRATTLPSATPILSSDFPALSYDAGARSLRLAPGDASLRRARLCTPLNAYQSPQAIYLVANVADALGLSLPAQARVTHTYPGRLNGESVTRILEVRRHPVAGIKVTGEEADLTGCDLLLSADVRQALGFPADLGEFNAAPRFDHGWVTIEFLAAP
jgi:hypothetical protein